MNKKIFTFFIFGLVLVSGCIQQTDIEAQAKDKCILACEAAKAENINLSDGPCLSNEIAADWVCDIAHSPRQDVDNLAENQCSAYGKTAHHFIEVDEDCNFIKAV